MEKLTYQEELEQICKAAGGLLRPVDVVNYAVDPETALHKKFQWDDSTAALQYRLQQAREIIRVCVHTIPSCSEPVQTYVSLTADRRVEDGGYRTMVDVMDDPDLRASLLVEAKKEMRCFERKYAQLTELADVFLAMQKVQKA